MSARDHRYCVTVQWTGNTGTGTRDYRGYDRAHCISAPSKPDIVGSSDPAFRGDPRAWNPEELLVASISACHQLWYLHLAAEAGISVTDYKDNAEGTMEMAGDGGGHFSGVTLRPCVTITPDSDMDMARALHDRAHELCFIARSINFPVTCEPEILVGK